MHRTNRTIACLLALFCCIGCEKFIKVDPPKNELTAGAVFSTDSLAQEAVTGIYIKIMSTNQCLLNGGMSVYPALSADELIRTRFIITEDQFFTNSLLPDNYLVLFNFWRSGYATIYQTNICLENLSRSTAIRETTKQQLTGEVKFIRALCYWYLVNLFGDVPLTTTTNVDVNATLPRAPADQVYQLITTDLQSALSLLSDTGTNIKPTKFAAAALLARVYCYLSNWSQAEAFADSVINAGLYTLPADLNKVFLATSPETILQFAPVLNNNSTSEGLSFVPANNSIPPTYTLTNSLLASFEPNDHRQGYWTRSVTINRQTYHHPYKYKINASSSAATEFNVVLRLAEQYLLRAEAEAHNNKIEDAVADINTLRNRAGLASIQSNISMDSCLSVIEQEKRKEFFAEWGHRWFDLKRSTRIDTVLTINKGNAWQSTDRLYPIPLLEMQQNAYLTQNMGY
ncbi:MULTISPECIES: RagB/SusD family nutrient uptake outer membrane protein [Niastella]|uniref:RagB/SusD family nutrient uptake outer membrane protein n=1 Tax=Niastella soli TaxID=2821487 RepID=A0ABS3YXD6_9BACT|nr:RagB/SusD family nutrient uptake outer membrane protein [Niastella soli]MBO9202408.1 RagB/SusD family nutrient uptake outer membrane protein [Niastella soli]